MTDNLRITLLGRSLLVGVGAFVFVLIFFLVLPDYFGLTFGTGYALLNALLAGTYFAIASWFADRDEEP